MNQKHMELAKARVKVNTKVNTNVNAMNDIQKKAQEEVNAMNNEEKNAMLKALLGDNDNQRLIANQNQRNKIMKEMEELMKVEKIYDSQKTIAMDILGCIVNRIPLITLCAPMQFGKTGCMVYLAYLLLTHNDDNLIKNLEKTFILTGLNDVTWKEQTIKRLPESLKAQVYHNSTLKRLKKKIDNDELKDSIIMIDECHIGSGMDSLVNKTLEDFLDVKKLLENNITILDISATADAVLLDSEKWGEYHKKIIPELPKNYCWFPNLLDKERVKQIGKSFEEDIEKIKEDIKGYREPKYHLIRIQNVKNKDIKEKMGMDIKTFYQGDNINFDIAPSKHTIVLLKNRLAVAKTLPLKNIGICYETSSQDSTHVQGLPGRLCGYNRNITDNFPKLYCDITKMDKYVKLFKSKFNYRIPTLSWKSNTIDKKLNTTNVKQKNGTFVDPINVLGINNNVKYEDENGIPILVRLKSDDMADIPERINVSNRKELNELFIKNIKYDPNVKKIEYSKLVLKNIRRCSNSNYEKYYIPTIAKCITDKKYKGPDSNCKINGEYNITIITEDIKELQGIVINGIKIGKGYGFIEYKIDENN